MIPILIRFVYSRIVSSHETARPKGKEKIRDQRYLSRYRVRNTQKENFSLIHHRNAAHMQFFALREILSTI